MSDIDKLEKLRKKIEDLKSSKIQYETKLEELKKRKQILLEKCKNLGIEPNKIKIEIEKLNLEIETEVLGINKIMEQV